MYNPGPKPLLKMNYGFHFLSLHTIKNRFNLPQ
jgi:hypothetical protein